MKINSKKFVLYSFKLFKKNIFIMCLLCLQIAVSIIYFSKIINEIEYVISNKELINAINASEDIYCLTTYDITNSSNNLKWMNEINNIDGVYGVSNNALVSYYVNDYIGFAMEYGDTILDMMNVKMIDGEWFNSDNLNQGEYIPVVAVNNYYNVGDIIDISWYLKTDYSVKGKVIGCMDPNQKVLEMVLSSSSSMSYENLIGDVGFNFVLPYDQMQKHRDKLELAADGFSQAETSLFLKIEKNADIDKIREKCSHYGMLFSISELQANYERTLKSTFLTLIIKFLVYAVMSILGTIGINGIIVMRNKRTYALFFMLGLTKKKCVIIEVIRTSLIIVISLLLTIFFTTAGAELSIAQYIGYCTYSIPVIIGMILYSVFIYFISCMEGIRVIRNSSLFELYKGNY